MRVKPARKPAVYSSHQSRDATPARLTGTRARKARDITTATAWALHGPGRVLERNAGLHVREAVADALYARLGHLPLGWHEEHHSGDVQQRVQQASQALASFTESQLTYLQNAVNVLGPLVALFLVLSSITGGVALFGAAHRGIAAARGVRHRAPRSASTRRSGGAGDLFSAGLTWSLVGLYAWDAQRAIAGGAPLLLGGVLMVYQYANQAGGVIASTAANLQNFSRYKVDFASADPIFEATDRNCGRRDRPRTGG